MPSTALPFREEKDANECVNRISRIVPEGTCVVSAAAHEQIAANQTAICHAPTNPAPESLSIFRDYSVDRHLW